MVTSLDNRNAEQLNADELFERLQSSPHGLTGGEALGRFATAEQRYDRGRILQASVTRKVRLTLNLHIGGLLGTEVARGARTLTLGLHLAFEPLAVDVEFAFTRDVGGQIGREAVGVVQEECRRARQFGGVVGEFAVEDAEAVLERLTETLLLLREHADHDVTVLNHVGVRRAQLGLRGDGDPGRARRIADPAGLDGSAPGERPVGVVGAAARC